MSEKTCFKCLKILPFESFYKHSKMTNRRMNKCIECTKNDVKKHRQDNLEKIRAYDRLRGNLPHRVVARKEYAKTEAYKESHKKIKWNETQVKLKDVIALTDKKPLF